MAESTDSMSSFFTTHQLTKADITLLTQRLQDMSREELFQEFGRLQQANNSNEQAVAAAEKRERILRNEHTELTAKKGELTAANAELSQGLEASKAEVELLKEQIAGLQAQIVKMEKTIKVQSEQISKKPEVNNATPHRHNHVAPPFVHPDMLSSQHDPRALVYAQPPPPYNARRTQSSNTYTPPIVIPQQSSAIRASTTSSPDHYAPPTLSRQQSFVTQSLVPFSTTPVPQVQDELTANVNALVLQTAGAAEAELPTELNQLFKLSETWARNYANVPDMARDQTLPQSLIDAFCKLSDANLAFGLLSSGSSRYFLVAKVINNWITGDLLRIALLKGFSPKTDQTIGEAKKKFQDKDAQINVQRACMEAIATTVAEIQEEADFHLWLEISIDTKAAATWKIFSALLAPGADTAWDDFRYLVAEAHRVALKILSLPLKVTFDYPNVGQHSYFEPSSMLNRDPLFQNKDPKTLKRQLLKVRLGVTPVVVTTDIIGDTIIPKTVHLANVLLMQ